MPACEECLTDTRGCEDSFVGVERRQNKNQSLPLFNTSRHKAPAVQRSAKVDLYFDRGTSGRATRKHGNGFVGPLWERLPVGRQHQGRDQRADQYMSSDGITPSMTFSFSSCRLRG